MHEHGEPWWNDINRGKLLICPPGLSGNPTSSHSVAKQEELMKEIMNLAYEIFLSYFKGFFNMPSNPRADSFKKGVLRIFIALINPLFLAGSEPAKSWSNGKCANH
jgi:hypothetical protein